MLAYTGSAFARVLPGVFSSVLERGFKKRETLLLKSSGSKKEKRFEVSLGTKNFFIRVNL